MKKDALEPSFTGQLGSYIALVNDRLRTGLEVQTLTTLTAAVKMFMKERHVQSVGRCAFCTRAVNFRVPVHSERLL